MSATSTGMRYDVPAPVSFERWRNPLSRLEVRWLPGWTPEAEEALAALPPMSNCPPDLFRKLMTNPEAGAKRCAMVSRNGAPVALIGLRHRGGHRWQLVTDREVSPRSWAPTAAGWLFPSLRALQSDVEINEWDRPLPEFARAATRYPLYQLDLQANYRDYWRQTGRYGKLKEAEARTRKLTFEVDTAGIAAWTIRTWSERWGEQNAASDLLLAADYFSGCGRLHAFALMDTGIQCAGLTALADGDDLILLTTARLDADDSRGVGTRVHELAIDWASGRGFKTVTFGIGRVDSYKRWWAPAVSDSWSFRVHPASLDVLKRGRAVLSSVLG